VPALDAAFALMHESGTAVQNSYVCLITCSSRTADIEEILVKGARSPRRLIVVLSHGALQKSGLRSDSTASVYSNPIIFLRSIPWRS
jgi:hypothetical protein